MIYNTILCLGDSQTYGSRDEYNRAWPFELCDMMSEEYKQNWIPIVRARPGFTSADLLRNVYNWILGINTYKVIVLIGTNDAKPKVATPSIVFKKNLIGTLRTIEVLLPIAKLYLCTIPDLGIFGSPDFNKGSQQLINNFNSIISFLANRNNHISLIDLCEIPKQCYADTVHFNNSGALEIARRVKEKIEEEY